MSVPPGGGDVLETLSELHDTAKEMRSAVHAGAHRHFFGRFREEARALSDLRNRVVFCAVDLSLSLANVSCDGPLREWVREVQRVATNAEVVARKISWRSGKGRMNAVCHALEVLLAHYPGGLRETLEAEAGNKEK